MTSGFGNNFPSSAAPSGKLNSLVITKFFCNNSCLKEF